jgi:hypothetical protein
MHELKKTAQIKKEEMITDLEKPQKKESNRNPRN